MEDPWIGSWENRLTGKPWVFTIKFDKQLELSGEDFPRIQFGEHFHHPSLGGIFSASQWDLPSGKRLHNYGKSPFSMGKSTINGHFH